MTAIYVRSFALGRATPSGGLFHKVSLGLIGMLWFVLGSCPLDANAHKVETHIWIAQNIINELEAGQSLAFTDVKGRPMPSGVVRDNVRSAILANREAFLLGSIGPDAFPGIYEGQMTIHPGNELIGWGTGEWLEHMMRNARTEEEISFAYGALVHAASDIFAHTYVNTLAGDIYLLTDNELDVERRHFLIEGYVATKMPALRAADGAPLASIPNLVLKDGKLALPLDYLHRVFIDDDTAAREFSINGAPHFKAVHDLNRELTSLTKDGGVLDRLHLLSQKLFAYFYADMQVSDDELREFNRVHQKLLDATNKGIDEWQEADQNFREEAGKLLNTGHDAGMEALNEAGRTLAKIRELHVERAELENWVLDKARQIDALLPSCTKTCEEVCRAFDPSGITCVLAEEVCRTVCPDLISDLERARDAHQASIGLVDEQLAQLSEKYREAIASVHNTAMQIYEAESRMLHAAVNLLQRFNEHVDPIQSLFRGWLSDNRLAMNRYFEANGVAIRNAMLGSSPMDPLENWMQCDLLLILGVAAPVMDGVCASKDTISQVQDLLDNLERLAVGHDPIKNELADIRADLEVSFRIAARKELIEFGSRETRVDLEEVIKIITTKPTADLIDGEFSRTDTAKNLLVMDSISRRIDTDMSLDLATGTFNPEKFSMIYNSQVLSRLALLDANQVNNVFKAKLLDGQPQNENLLFRFAKSIDGNHQWLPHSPPYLRGNDSKPVCGFDYGYPPKSVLWEFHAFRRPFRKIFKGPLIPSLEVPTSLGLPSVVPASYPYRPTRRKPYPAWKDSDDVGVCVPIKR